jgi:hypothetical protein
MLRVLKLVITVYNILHDTAASGIFHYTTWHVPQTIWGTCLLYQVFFCNNVLSFYIFFKEL